jgi:hypothetical protein
MVLVFSLKIHPQCNPTTTKPDIKAFAVRNVASSNLILLANLGGCLKLPAEKAPTNLPAETNPVAFGPTRDDGFSAITFSGECVGVKFDYKRDGTEETEARYVYANTEMHVLNVDEDKDREEI